MHNKFFAFLALLCVSHLAMGQITGPKNGVAQPHHEISALTNGHIILSAEKTLENGSILIQDGIILAVGEDLSIPENAIIYDLKGKYVYPSFIDLYTQYGVPKAKAKKRSFVPVYEGKNNGEFYWNESIHPEFNASEIYNYDSKSAESFLKLGFGTVLTHQQNGIMRGTAALVSLGSNDKGSAMLNSQAGQVLSYSRGNSIQNYPTSLMGCMALIRQVYYDAEWYNANVQNVKNYSLEAIELNKELPYLVVANNHQNILRSKQLLDEFDIDFIALGGGDEYKRLPELKDAEVKLLVPLNFPKPYDVKDPYDAEYVSLKDLRHWEAAPSNPYLLEKNEMQFAITSYKDQKSFWKNLRLAVSRGLSPEGALKALTETPAEYLGMEDKMGTLEKGKVANLFISDSDVFTNRGQVLENWTLGKRHIYKDAFQIDPSGIYNLNFEGKTYTFKISATPKGYGVYSDLGGKADDFQKGSITIESNIMTIVFTEAPEGVTGPLRMIGKVNFQGKILDGKLQDGNGNWLEWSAIKQEEVKPELGKTLQVNAIDPKITYPNLAFGDTVLPQEKTYFIKGATIWTCDSTGNYTGNIIVSDGKIKQVGKNVSNQKGAEFIDGSDLHITPGIIDEHSHIAISRGVNESGQNNSAEVRIGDVVNYEDINIYRQLSGGVTSVQLLHGSANPIGGQAQVIKLRWGQTGENMKFQGSQKSIKFALGENVKQSNSNSFNSIRFPQTRMGVEQMYVDAFTRAKEYQMQWDTYNSAQGKKKKNTGASPPRKDLELDALVEILNGERNITCHSYVKTEILMLMNVADSMGFKVNTFTHILEGYKVADEMHAHGASASTFSDWWAYKFEVNDAIPYNAAILNQRGVLTAINSDDAEMGRRLNQEAAKTVKYGGVSEIEAMNMVTINPATMLKIDDKVGSITEGKDADLVLWSGHPLAIDSHPKIVWIDGMIYYSESKSQAILEANYKERQALIMKMIDAKDKGATTRKIKPSVHQLYHCDTFEDEMND